MSALQTLYRLFFPPRCLSCGELMRLDRVKGALCESCAPLWERAVRSQCKQCFLPYFDCRCTPPRLGRLGVKSHVKLFPYDEGSASCKAAQRMVLKMKKSGNTALFSFMASELFVGVRQAVESCERERASRGLPPLSTVITYLPRAARTTRATGVDQARELARSLSRMSGFPLTKALLRRRDPLLSQKSLTAKERLQNVRGLFSLGESVAGMRVLLLDDIVTTGVSAAEAVRVLKKGGAAEVLMVSVASTERHAHVKYKKLY